MHVDENYQLFFLCLNVLRPPGAKNHQNLYILGINQLGLIQYLLPPVKNQDPGNSAHYPSPAKISEHVGSMGFAV